MKEKLKLSCIVVTLTPLLAISSPRLSAGVEAAPNHKTETAIDHCTTNNNPEYEETVWPADADEPVYSYWTKSLRGNTIEAFELTNTDTPRSLWRIQGTALADHPGGDFRDLAYTASTPQPATIRWCTNECVDRKVLFFGGGYDPVYDSVLTAPDNSRGNALYMVDALSGELIWSAGSGYYHSLDIHDMRHSFAADTVVLDRDRDGYADTLFAIDIQGYLFRFDFHKAPYSPVTFARGGLIADIGGGSQLFRRFVNTPDIAYFDTENDSPLLTIAIASGNRGTPIQRTATNYLFVLFDHFTQQAPEHYRYVDGVRIITPYLLSKAGDRPTSPYGWFLPLQANGEKALFRTYTFNGEIFLSTFVPGDHLTDTQRACTDPVGDGRLYIVDALTGAGAPGSQPQGDVAKAGKTQQHRRATPPFREIANLKATAPLQLQFHTAKSSSSPSDALHPLPDTPTTVITPCIGDQCIDLEMTLPLHKTYWRVN